jgi:regulator of protease activity HflC (stomatin/prohibitin superfamily)
MKRFSIFAGALLLVASTVQAGPTYHELTSNVDALSIQLNELVLLVEADASAARMRQIDQDREAARVEKEAVAQRIREQQAARAQYQREQDAREWLASIRRAQAARELANPRPKSRQFSGF